MLGGKTGEAFGGFSGPLAKARAEMLEQVRGVPSDPEKNRA